MPLPVTLCGRLISTFFFCVLTQNSSPPNPPATWRRDYKLKDPIKQLLFEPEVKMVVGENLAEHGKVAVQILRMTDEPEQLASRWIPADLVHLRGTDGYHQGLEWSADWKLLNCGSVLA
jgi:hypothetical protein